MNLKNTLLPLICVAAVFTTFTAWNNNATAQSGPSASAEVKLPFNRNCTITLDTHSNSRTTMTPEMQQLAGFVRQDTIQGTLVAADAEWLVLKIGNSENWVPRDNVLLMRASQ